MTTKAKRRANHADHEAGDAPSTDGGRLIKYMGASHIRVLEKGEDFGGRLVNNPLPKRVEWNLGNNHMVNSEDVGLSDEAVEILIALDGDQFDSGQWENADEEGYVEPSEDNTLRSIKEFRDVTNDKTVMPSLAQQIFLGMSQHQTTDDAIRTMEANVTPPNPAAQSVMSPDGEAVVSGSSDAEPASPNGENDGDDSDDNNIEGEQSPSATAPTTTVGGSTDGSGGDQ